MLCEYLVLIYLCIRLKTIQWIYTSNKGLKLGLGLVPKLGLVLELVLNPKPRQVSNPVPILEEDPILDLIIVWFLLTKTKIAQQ